MADACIHLLENLDSEDLYSSGNTHINIGSGQDQSINNISMILIEVIGFKGELKFDSSKPDGTAQKLLDVSALESKGWKYKTGLSQGIEKSYNSYLNSL